MLKLTLKENSPDSQIEIIRYEWPHIFYGLSKSEFTHKLIHKLQGRAFHAFYFGSVATNKFSHKSDIDLIIVKETDIPFTKRPLEFEDLDRLCPRLDLLIYTPTEWNQLFLENPKMGFWKEVFQELEPIIENGLGVDQTLKSN